MGTRFRFAILSDPHVALPATIPDHPGRFHLVEVSIPSLEQILAHLATENLDFLLIPGDLTQHGEWANHHWLADRLRSLPFPVYVVPGNHDVIARDATDTAIGLADFPQLYRHCGYGDSDLPYYHAELLPGVHLVGLNSNGFDAAGKQLGVGRIDRAQFRWLDDLLPRLRGELVIGMLHHNVLEHLPGQAISPMGQRYMLANHRALIHRLEAAGVPLLCTGHLHVQDIARRGNLCEILTGSLVSYPHPYRILEADYAPHRLRLQVTSHRVRAVPGWPDLQASSHQWMCDRAFAFLVRLFTLPPLNLPQAEAEAIAPQLTHFWATLADGDPQFDFSHLSPAAQRALAPFDTTGPDGRPQRQDNHTTLELPLMSPLSAVS